MCGTFWTGESEKANCVENEKINMKYRRGLEISSF